MAFLALHQLVSTSTLLPRPVQSGNVTYEHAPATSSSFSQAAAPRASSSQIVRPLINSLISQVIDSQNPATPSLNTNRTLNANRAQQFLPYLNLSDSAYQDSGAPVGWDRLNMTEIGGVPLHDAHTGFDAVAFRNRSTGEVSIAFRGSENPQQARNDWQDDSLQANGQVSPQLYHALALSRAAANTYGSHLSFTGHSLGGALAQVAGLNVGRPTYTFNAVGLNPATQSLLGSRLNQNQHLIHNTAMRGDIVTDLDNAQDGDSLRSESRLVGNTYYADDSGFTPLRILNNPFTRHLLLPLRESLESTSGQVDQTNDTMDLAVWALQSFLRS